MKRKLFIVLFASLCVLFSFSAVHAVDVNVSGDNVSFTEESGSPYIDGNNRTMVPLRATMEKAGAEVTWDQATQTATVVYGDTKIDVPVGEKFIYKNGEKIANDTEAAIVNSRTYLPIRAVLEAAGFDVYWDAANKTVVTSPAEKVDAVYSKYAAASEKLNKAKSYEMNLDMDVKATASDSTESLAIDMKMSGPMKQITISDTDMQIAANLNTKMTIAGETAEVPMEMYFKDGYFYTKVGEEKVKVKMDMEEAYAQASAGADVDFDEKAIVMAYEKDNKLTMILSKEYMNDFIKTALQGSVDITNASFGDITLIANLDKDGNLADYDMIFSFSAEIQGITLNYVYDLGVKISKIDNVTITFPTDLNTYKEATN